MKTTLTALPQQTPIELLLKIDSEGMTTARALYEFLELDASNYSRWAKVNIENNTFASENVDFTQLVLHDELAPNPAKNYRLTTNFAKKLAMSSNSERGNQARDYFIKVEDVLKQKVSNENRQKAPTPKLPLDKTKRLEIQERNAKAKIANLYLRIADNDALPTNYRGIFLSYASKELSGQDILPLPKSEAKTYSATDIGDMFGISSAMVGRIANANDLKTSEFGETYHDKARHSSKQVDSFRYFDSVIPEFEKLLGREKN